MSGLIERGQQFIAKKLVTNPKFVDRKYGHTVHDWHAAELRGRGFEIADVFPQFHVYHRSLTERGQGIDKWLLGRQLYAIMQGLSQVELDHEIHAHRLIKQAQLTDYRRQIALALF